MEPRERLHHLRRKRQEYQDAVADAQQHGAEILKQVRKEYGWTQKELSALLGYDDSYLSKVERGVVPAGVPLLMKLMEAIEGLEDIP